MKVIRSQTAQIPLAFLNQKERRYVLSWIDRLKSWENDKTIPESSHLLEDTDNVYVLHTDSDFRIFFRVEEDQITVMDITTRAVILSFGPDSE